MLQKTEPCLIVVIISYSSFKQEGLHLGLRAEAFLINALIDSPDDEINSLIIRPVQSDLKQFGDSFVHQHQPPVWPECVVFMEALVHRAGLHSCGQH